MKEIFYNYDNLTKEDIDEVVIRTKALIINSNNEITLGYSNKTYQFPGGHLKEGETLVECLIREIKEETGIEIKDTDLKPFAKLSYYSKNYRNSLKNRQNDIYYYVIKTDKKFNIDNSELDEGEVEGNYIPITIPFNDMEKILIESVNDNPINKIVVDEMLKVIKEYNRINDLL